MINPSQVSDYTKEEYLSFFEKQFKKGLEKYKTPLKTFNGRDAYADAMDELTDLSMYIQQLRMERNALCWIIDMGIALDELPFLFTQYVEEHSNEYRIHRNND